MWILWNAIIDVKEAHTLLLLASSIHWFSLLLLHQNKAWLGSLSGPPTSGAASSPISTLAWRSSAGATTWSPTMTAFWAQRPWTWCWRTSPWTGSLVTRRCPATRPSASVRPWWTLGCLSRWASKFLGRRRSEPHLRTVAAVCTGSSAQRPAHHHQHRWTTQTHTPPAPSRAAMTHLAWTGTRTATVRLVRGTDSCHNTFTLNFWFALFSFLQS